MRKLLSILVIALLALTACAPTVEEPAEALALEQTYTAATTNGNITIDYPDGWFINGEFPDLGVIIASAEELVTSTDFDGTTIEDGDVYINILFAPESLLEQDTPSAVLQQMIDMVGESEGAVSEIETRTLNGKVAAFVTLDSEDTADGLFIVIDSGDAYSTMVVAFPDGELDQYQATAEAIAGSIEYIVDEAEATPEMTEEAEATEDAEMTEEVEMTAEATEESE